MIVVLRKSVDRFSAGTRVHLVETLESGGYKVEATYTHVDWFTDFTNKRQQRREVRTVEFDVDANDLVPLRSRSGVVPAIPRSQRDNRVAKRVMYEMGMRHNG